MELNMLADIAGFITIVGTIIAFIAFLFRFSGHCNNTEEDFFNAIMTVGICIAFYGIVMAFTVCFGGFADCRS
jgi:hypothetical protein